MSSFHNLNPNPSKSSNSNTNPSLLHPKPATMFWVLPLKQKENSWERITHRQVDPLHTKKKHNKPWKKGTQTRNAVQQACFTCFLADSPAPDPIQIAAWTSADDDDLSNHHHPVPPIIIIIVNPRMPTDSEGPQTCMKMSDWSSYGST